MNQEDKIQAEYDEINLMDYVVVLLKRKGLIFSIFLIAVVATGVFSHFAPKIYEIDTSLEIGKIGETIIEEPLQVKEKINNDIYELSIREKLGIQERYPKTQATNLTKANLSTNLIMIKIESAESQKAKSILEEMNNLILVDHEEKIKSQKELIENNIKTAQDKIKLVESNIEKTRNKIKPLENDIERIENKIEYTEEEKENLEAKIGALEKVLVYEQTPGTQFALFDTKEKLANKKQEIENLYMMINSLKRTKEDLDVQINSLETNIGDLNAQINSLRTSLDNIKNTKVIKNPTISDKPIKPKFLLNVAIAGVLGLFIGTFLAFSKEWWQKNKERV